MDREQDRTFHQIELNLFTTWSAVKQWKYHDMYACIDWVYVHPCFSYSFLW